MRYWDSSALIPLFVRQSRTDQMAALVAEDDGIASWWGTRLECWGAFCRLERSGHIGGAEFRIATDRFRASVAEWSTIGADDALQRHAERVLRVHPLRTADALQLAACHVASEIAGERLPFVSLDRRLAAIAEREGFEAVEG